MDRAYLSGASGSPPAAPGSPSIGYPTAGNPGVSPATIPGPYFYHAIMEELLGVILAAGITPAQGTLTQLLTALRSAGVFTTAASNDSTTKAATTAFVNPASSIAVSGYVKLPCGLIVQWGAYALVAAATVTVTLPLAFPTSRLMSFCGLPDTGASASSVAHIRESTSTNSQIVIICGSTLTATGRWIAVGY